jgi:hypothetical protein
MRPPSRHELTRALPRATTLAAAACLAVTALAGCSSDSSEASAEPTPTAGSDGSSPSSSSSSPSPSFASSPTTARTPERPSRPTFAPGDKGQREFAEYVVASWGYALATNDATALTGLSPSKKEQCRGCKELTAELARRDKAGWHVAFPGATVRHTTLKREDDRILATTVADIPASQSYFDDGSFRNDNDAHRGARFLVDLRIDGQAKKRHYVLLAFSVR